MAVNYPGGFDPSVGAGPVGNYTNTKTNAPAGADHGIAHSDISTAIVALEHVCGIPPNDSTKYLNGTGNWTTVLTGVSANANNKATLGSDSLVFVQGTAAGVAATLHTQTVSGDDPQLTNARTPTPHASTHNAGGSDVLASATATTTGFVPTPPNSTVQFFRGDASWQLISSMSIAWTQLTGIPSYVPGSSGTNAQVWSGGAVGWTAISGLAVSYLSLVNVPTSFTPSVHATTHKSGGNDAIALDTLAAPTDILTLNVSTSAHGLCPKAPNSAAQVLLGTGLFGTLAYASLSGIPASFTPSAHASTHITGGSDIIPAPTTSASGLVPALPTTSPTLKFHRGDNTWTQVDWTGLTSIPASFTPSAHAPTHQNGGSDVLALDTLGTPSDITTLNASTAAHGLLRKLDNVGTHYLDGTGGWSTPPTPLLYNGINSVLISGSNISLVNDSASPGNNMLYGTSGTGVLGYRAASGLPVAYSSLTGVPATFAPSAHASSHITGGSDVIPLPTTSASGLVPALPTTFAGQKFHRGDNTWIQVDYTTLLNTPTTFNPSAHASSHLSGASDAIPAPTTSKSGLVPPIPGNTTTYFRGDGTFSALPPSTILATVATAFTWGSGVVVTVDTTANINTADVSILNFPGYGGHASFSISSGTTLTLYPQLWAGDGAIGTNVPAGTHVYRAEPIGQAQVADAHGDPKIGFMPGLPNDTTKFLRGDGTFAVGPGGAAGQPAYTLSTAGFTVPAVGSSVTVSVSNTSWVALNEILWVQDAGGPGVAGPMQVTAITSTSLTLLNVATSTLPAAHASTHITGGSDIIPAPTTTASGLVPVLPSTRPTGRFLRGDGAFNYLPLHTMTTAAFTMPTWGGNVSVSVDDTSWMASGMILFVGAGTTGEYMIIVSITDAATVVLSNYTGPINSGTIAAGTSIEFGAMPPATATSPGILPAPPNNTTTFLRGDCTFADPISSDAGNIATRGSDNRIYVPYPTPGGVLRYVSATQLSFLPLNGNYIKINGLLYPIPASGNGIAGLANTNVYIDGTAGQNLAASSLYRVYCFNNAGTLTADFSTVAHATSATPGNIGTEIKSGVDTRSLIGMVYTNASSQFVDAASTRWTRSWLNGGRIGFNFTAAISITATASTITPVQVTVLSWNNEPVIATVNGYGTGTVNTNTMFALCYDGNAFSQSAITSNNTTSKYENFSASWAAPVSETLHTIALYGSNVAANTYSGTAWLSGVVG